VNVAKANPNPGFPYYPQTPVNTPPIIDIKYPIQNKTQSASITLNFTVTKPMSWFGYIPDQFRLDDRNITIYYSVVRIRSYHYTLDNEKSQDFPVNDSSGEMEVPSENFGFSKSLDLQKGNHDLTVYVDCQSFYYPAGSMVWDTPSNVNFTEASETIAFTVETPESESQPEPFPTTLVIASLSTVSIVLVVLLVYFKKRKH
jgi:hypothetical protein